jgi:cell shape-determining protein MreC
MTYLRRTNVAENRSRRLAIGIILGLVFLVFIQYTFPRFLPTIFYPITTFFWKTESGSVGIVVRMVQMVQSKYSLIKENKRLVDEVSSRDASMLLLGALKKENEELKNTLGRTTEGKVVLGVILSRPPVSPYDTLVIDIGAQDGLSVGNKVYTDGDILVGDVAEVYPRQAKVSLYSSPGRVVPVVIGSSNAETQATGRGAGNFIAKLPVELGVEEGDTIVMPQIRPHSFGVVERVMVDSSDSLQTILFKTPVNIHEFKFVEVDTDS